LRINNQFTRMFGYTSEEVVGRFINDLIAPDELRSEAETYTQLITHGASVNVETGASVFRYRSAQLGLAPYKTVAGENTTHVFFKKM